MISIAEASSLKGGLNPFRMTLCDADALAVDFYRVGIDHLRQRDHRPH
jgi:hypothetical protein